MQTGVTLGIDPGLKGGLCFLTGCLDTDYKSAIAMPVRQVGKHSRPDLKAIKGWFNQQVRVYGFPALVVIERLQAMNRFGKDRKRKVICVGCKRVNWIEGSGQGVTSAHTSGLNGGILLGFLETLGLPIEEPTSKQWKSLILAGYEDKNKEAAIAICRQRFPSLSLKANSRCRVDHDGIADAVCLSLYGQFRIGTIKA